MKISYLKRSLIFILLLISLPFFPKNLKASQSNFSISPYILMGENGQHYLKFNLFLKTNLDFQAETIFNGSKVKKMTININKKDPISIIPIENAECGTDLRFNINKKIEGKKKSLFISKKFPTLPCNKLEALNFVFLSDTQNSTGHLKSISKRIGEIHKISPLHFIIHGGDFVTKGGSEKMWKNYFEMRFNHSNIPLIPVIGNHEYYNDLQNGTLTSNYKKYMGNNSQTTKGHSLLSFPHFNLIRLNSNFDKLTKEEQEEQEKWLEESLELSKENNKKIIICFHHSPFSSVSSSSNYHVQRLRKGFVPLFEKYNENIIIVLSGHKHLYERSIKNKVHYLVSGPAGGLRAFSIRKNPYSVFKKSLKSTFTHLSIKNDILKLKTFGKKGELIDFLTFYL